MDNEMIDIQCRFVNHMLHITLKESSTSLGDFHCNGFMGKLLYSLFLTASCFLKSSNEKNRWLA